MFVGAIVDLIFASDDSSAILTVLVGSILISVRCGSAICTVRGTVMTAVAILAFVLAIVRAGTKFGLLFGTAATHLASGRKLKCYAASGRSSCDVVSNKCVLVPMTVWKGSLFRGPLVLVYEFINA